MFPQSFVARPCPMAYPIDVLYGVWVTVFIGKFGWRFWQELQGCDAREGEECD